ncbi:MAG: hypothetical protein ACLSAJ_13700 [Intestinibacter bartlettii]|uniref:hypothetical protein n=1 Tax=Intestinibacter bartlettii TaxID=261299 RepID=UPI0039A29FBA
MLPFVKEFIPDIRRVVINWFVRSEEAVPEDVNSPIKLENGLPVAPFPVSTA